MEKQKILIIDDDPNIRKTLSDILKVKGYEPFSAKSGTEGLALLEQSSADIVVIDLGLPDISGIEVLSRVKADRPFTEAIILTGNASLDSAIEATNKGAFSYLLKPYEFEQLMLHIRRATEKQQAQKTIAAHNLELGRVNDQLKKANADLMHEIAERKKVEEEIITLSITDQLTGLHNRRGFITLSEQQLKLSGRTKRGMLLFFADLDGMKWINDTLGHEEGDKALIEVATLLRETFRLSDVIARVGGDEFAVLAIDTLEVNSEILAGRLQSLIDTHNHQENRRYTLSVSVGCSCYDPENPCSIDELMTHADKLMYEHKRGKKASRV